MKQLNVSQSKRSNKSNMVANANIKKNSPLKGSTVKNRQVIMREEFLFDLDSHTQFHCEKVEINPGLDSTFPWTSGPSVSYQKWKFKNVKFMFKTSVSTFSPGMAMLAVQTDISRDIPRDKVEFLELSGATRGPIWKDFTLNISKEEQKVFKEYFIRTSPKDEPKLYDPFYLAVGIDGVDLDFPAGEIWISYELELFDPAPIDPTEIIGKFRQWTFTGPSTGTGPNAITPTTPLAGLIEENIGELAVTYESSTTITFGESFTGLITYAITTSGLANSIYEPSAQLAVIALSSEGEIISGLAVGGNPSNGSGNNQVVRSLNVLNFRKGDKIVFNNAGWYQSGSNSTIAIFSFYKIGNYSPNTVGVKFRKNSKAARILDFKAACEHMRLTFNKEDEESIYPIIEVVEKPTQWKSSVRNFASQFK